MKIGFFCGTFDPVHNGHLRVAIHIREEFQLDKVFFLPAGVPPNKASKQITESKLRLDMLASAVDSWPFLDVSTIETDRPGLSYMIDSVGIMKEQFPGTDIYLLMGDDNLATFSSWKTWEAIFDFVQIIVFRKDCRLQENHSFLEPYKNKILNSTAPVLEISSTEIRNRILTGKNTDLLLPGKVQSFILTNGLYKN